jgi:hypothetical protein
MVFLAHIYKKKKKNMLAPELFLVLSTPVYMYGEFKGLGIKRFCHKF